MQITETSFSARNSVSFCDSNVYKFEFLNLLFLILLLFFMEMDITRPVESFDEPKCSPIICPLYHYCGCGWTGSFENMMGHCIAKHGEFTSKGYKQDYEIEKFRTIKVVKDFPHIIEAHGNIFMVWLRKFPSGVLRLRLHSMGCCYDPSKYEGLITFQSFEELPLICYSEFEYRRGLDRLDDTKVNINTERFLRHMQSLIYTIRIKDMSLESYLSRIS